MRLALKIDVDTYRGTLEGVPRLLELLQAQQAQATFLFSLGPDHTGRAIKRVFRPGFLGKVKRTSVSSHYGYKTLLYGTLLPGPDIGLRCGEVMRSVRDAGFEVGVHCYDHVRWQDHVAQADDAWTEAEMRKTMARFESIFGFAPEVHGAAGWQMNRHALRLEQRLGLRYASDCRGSHPFIPVWDAEIVACPQLPTTLPTLDELIGCEGITENNVAAHILQRTEAKPETGHVYTLHAELEGMKLAPVFESLLLGWKAQGYDLVSLAEYYAGLDLAALPHHEFISAEVPGRSGTLACQGPRFLA